MALGTESTVAIVQGQVDENVEIFWMRSECPRRRQYQGRLFSSLMRRLVVLELSHNGKIVPSKVAFLLILDFRRTYLP
jgi:hypothetical protein